jgi:hypothetical protein
VAISSGHPVAMPLDARSLQIEMASNLHLSIYSHECKCMHRSDFVIHNSNRQHMSFLDSTACQTALLHRILKSADTKNELFILSERAVYCLQSLSYKRGKILLSFGLKLITSPPFSFYWITTACYVKGKLRPYSTLTFTNRIGGSKREGANIVGAK